MCRGQVNHRQFLHLSLSYSPSDSLCNHSVPFSLHLSSLYLIPPSSSLRGISTSPLGHSCIILDRLFHLQRSCFWSGLLSCLWITDELLSTFSGNLVERSVGQERAPLHFWTDSKSLGRYTYYFSLLQNELDSVVVNGQDSKCSISGICASKAVNQRNNSYFQQFCLKNKCSSVSTQSYRKGSHQMSGMSLRQIKRCHILLPEGSLPYLCILNKAAVTLFVCSSRLQREMLTSQLTWQQHHCYYYFFFTE